jgi:2-oxoglutarate ferredoxin oxidoreductase subunit alpha
VEGGPDLYPDDLMSKPITLEEVESVVIRFAGDSGDGIQLTGTQFSNTSAEVGNDISTLPDFPAEIRAPAGSLPGVSGYQLKFSSRAIHTPGDQPDVLVAFNPAALKVNLPDLEPGTLVIVNSDAFTRQSLQKAGYEENPLENGELARHRLMKIPISTLNARALEELGIPNRQVGRCKNFWALGLMYWLYDRPLEPTQRWIRAKFAKDPSILEANARSLLAGYAYGEAGELFTTHYHVARAAIEPGTYRKITGNEALALGCVAASKLAGVPLVYASYPITPASEILHELARHRNSGVRTIQAEDEMAAMGAALGAAFAGQLALTGTSGPGFALKSEMLSLTATVELPVVILNIQRAGPSTGMPTKPEQADLLQAMFGRHGECPVVVVAPATPSDCFLMAIEAFRIAIRHMMPVVLLSDGYLALGAEPWRLPEPESLPRIEVRFQTDTEGFLPYRHHAETMARPWAVPGTPGLEHRIGGLEKSDGTGHVSYDAWNHQRMTELRHERVERVAEDIPMLEVCGDPDGDLLVLGWGGTYGAIASAVERAQAEGHRVSGAHLRYLHPFPRNLGQVLSRFKRVLVPELNTGQLRFLLRARYLANVQGLNKVQGRPFKVSEIEKKIREMLAAR